MNLFVKILGYSYELFVNCREGVDNKIFLCKIRKVTVTLSQYNV